MTDKEILERGAQYFEKDADTNSMLVTVEDGCFFYNNIEGKNFAHSHAKQNKYELKTISRSDYDEKVAPEKVAPEPEKVGYTEEQMGIYEDENHPKKALHNEKPTANFKKWLTEQ